MKTKIILLLAILVMCCSNSYSQELSGKVVFFQTIGNIAVGIVNIDESDVCKINYVRYSAHQVEPGKHKVGWRPTGASNMHCKPLGMNIEVEPNKTAYIEIGYIQTGWFKADTVVIMKVPDSVFVQKIEKFKIKEKTKCN